MESIKQRNWLSQNDSKYANQKVLYLILLKLYLLGFIRIYFLVKYLDLSQY